MKRQVLDTAFWKVSGEAAGEIWNWLITLGSERANSCWGTHGWRWWPRIRARGAMTETQKRRTTKTMICRLPDLLAEPSTRVPSSLASPGSSLSQQTSQTSLTALTKKIQLRYSYYVLVDHSQTGRSYELPNSSVGPNKCACRGMFWQIFGKF